MPEKRILTFILAAFVALGSLYAVTTPVFEASDELWHYPMIRHLADGNPLPVQVFDPAQAGPWNQEASQPPLYYYAGAALTFWIDTSDMERVRRLNPHVDNGVVTVDGNTNLVVHDPSLSPWQGTLLAVRFVRIASVLMGAVTVFFTFHIARAVTPDRPEIALGAAAINAFTPMFLFISGAVNNDNLAIMLASMALFIMIRLVKNASRTAEGVGEEAGAGESPLIWQWLVLGTVIGLAVLTKEGTLGLVPLLAGTTLIFSWRHESHEQKSSPAGAQQTFASLFVAVIVRSLKLMAIALIPVFVIAGWWYYRNIVLYGDWLGWNAFIAVLGQRPQPASLAQLWDERWGFLASYWGLFGGVNVPMPGWIYTVLNGLLVLAVPGFILFGWRILRDWLRKQQSALQTSSLTLVPRWIATMFEFVSANFALVVSVLFSFAVIYGLISWATTTWSSQGRLAFTAISPLSTLLALGLLAWLPQRAAHYAAAVTGGFLLGVAALAPFLWIAPAYEPQPAMPPVEYEPADVVFGDSMTLTGYAVVSESADDIVSPGESVDVYLAWQVLEEMENDWSVFVHLNDPVLETPLAQRDMYPGGGLLATSFLNEGQVVQDRFRLRIPDTAPAPAELELIVGLYDLQTDERLAAEEGDAVSLQTVFLEPAEGEQENSAEINFGDEIALVDFEAAPRRLPAAGTIELRTDWKALRPLDDNYTLFAQLLFEDDTTRWAAADIAVESSGWTPGDVHPVVMSLDVDPEAAAGVYTLVVGAYLRDDAGNFNRLQLVREGRITMEDVLQLARIRIE